MLDFFSKYKLHTFYMNFYTLAAKMNKKIDKDFEKLSAVSDKLNREFFEDIAIHEYKKNCRLGIRLMQEFQELVKETKQRYFVTVRPDVEKINFEQFYILCKKFLERACILESTVSFEQKGTSDETLGNGFHIHMILNMTQRSKGEVLRDIQSTFRSCTAPNCIDVQVIKTQIDMTRCKAYIEQYESNDEHKIVTKDWDTLWRERNKIKTTYEGLLEQREPLYQVRLGAVTTLKWD